MKRATAVFLSLALIVPLFPASLAAGYVPGTYTGEGKGFGGSIKVEVTVSADRIEGVEVTENVESPNIGGKAIEALPSAIIEAQSTQVDAVSGATISSQGIIEAVNAALEKAASGTGGDETLPQLAAPIPYWGEHYSTCWKVQKPTQNYFRYKLYRMGDADPIHVMPINYGSEDISVCTNEFFAVNSGDLTDGTYYFTV